MGKNRGKKIIRVGNPRKPVHNGVAPNDILKTASAGARTEVKGLDGSRFRWLNESLYTESSSNSFELFQRDPKLFDAYHSGFRSQTRSWPVNPVDECLGYIRSNLKEGSSIGDFGCGDAKLAQVLNASMKMHSFDLVSTNSLVTACNIAHVPLAEKTLDMAVFSLSLMGTDWPKFIAEAQRCLKRGGILYIAEVQSRMGNFEELVSGFKGSFDVMKAENQKERYFVKIILKKTSDNPLFLNHALLKPCLYKKR